MSADDPLTKAEALLARLEAARTELEETDVPDEAIKIIEQLADLARQIEAELQRAREQEGA